MNIEKFLSVTTGQAIVVGAILIGIAIASKPFVAPYRIAVAATGGGGDLPAAGSMISGTLYGRHLSIVRINIITGDMQICPVSSTTRQPICS